MRNHTKLISKRSNGLKQVKTSFILAALQKKKLKENNKVSIPCWKIQQRVSNHSKWRIKWWRLLLFFIRKGKLTRMVHKPLIPFFVSLIVRFCWNNRPRLIWCLFLTHPRNLCCIRNELGFRRINYLKRTLHLCLLLFVSFFDKHFLKL